MKITPIDNKITLVVSNPGSDYFSELFPGELTPAQAVESMIEMYGDTWGPDQTVASIDVAKVYTVERKSKGFGVIQLSNY